jgi:hypothetical protein
MAFQSPQNQSLGITKQQYFAKDKTWTFVLLQIAHGCGVLILLAYPTFSPLASRFPFDYSAKKPLCFATMR